MSALIDNRISRLGGSNSALANSGSFPGSTEDVSQIPRSGSGVPINVVASTNAGPDTPGKALRPLVLLWLSQVLQQASEPIHVTKDQDVLWNELRFGELLCRLINALAPRSVGHIAQGRNTMSALENLTAFQNGAFTYGIDRPKYAFRPIDFINANPSGDETVSKLLGALLVFAATEKGFRVPDVSVTRVRTILETGVDPQALPPSPITNQTVDEPPQQAEKVHPMALLSRLHTVITQQNTIQRQATLSQNRLKALLRGLTDMDVQPNIAQLLRRLDDCLTGLEVALETYSSQVTTMETQQQAILDAVDNAALTAAVTAVEDETPDAVSSADPVPNAVAEPTSEFVSGTSTPTTPKSMFPKVPAEVANAGLPKSEMMRLSAVYELIETEADYVRDLTLMINYHKKQLEETQLIPETDIANLFSNINDLVPVNQQLLDRLYVKRDADAFIPEVGDAFVDVSESFKVYTEYCGNYPEAMKLLNKLQAQEQFKELLQKMMNSSEGRGLSLESFLIKPVQRICKYPLLIRELQKHTDKLSKDTITLNLAMTKIESVVTLVNEHTRQLGERDRIQALQQRIESPTALNLTDRRHIRDGPIGKVVGGKVRERYVLIFGDVLLVCAPIKNGKYALESAYDIADLALKPDFMKEGIPKGIKYAIQLVTISTRQDLTLCANSDEDRQKWQDALQQAIKVGTEESRKLASSDQIGTKRMSMGAMFVQQFNSLREDDDKARPTSWGSLSSRKTISKGGMAGSTLRGKRGWGSLQTSLKNSAALKKEVEFADLSTNSIDLDDMPNAEPDLPAPTEPEMAEADGKIWKRTLSAMGTSYYYCPDTKDTTWRLPENYTVLNPETGKPYVDEADDNSDYASDDAGAEDDMAEPIPGHPDWRRVDREGESSYFYNVLTRETSWVLPGIPADEPPPPAVAPEAPPE
ncbi:cytochrome c oxidase subunit 1 [Gaertneriomyces sp. JEL0708]|nr:cytochrome c oxidase subunit 1 [Gaertneriomyces sp. JEL0708]